MTRKLCFNISENEPIDFRRILFIFVITVFSILINYCGSALSEKIIFPLYLDSLLTIGVASLCGLIPALLCAFFSNLILSFFTKSTLLFSICHICTAVFSSLVFSLYDKQNCHKDVKYPIDVFMWAGLFSAISNAVLGNIIADLVNASQIGRPSVNIVVQGIYVVIPNLTVANYIGGFVENLVDKLIAALLSYGLYLIGIKILDKIKNN